MRKITEEEITKAVNSLEGMHIAVIDLFCGAGGTSTGIAEAEIDGKKIAKVVLCVNHDAWAIKSHEENHPDAIHLTEDVRKVKMGKLKPLILAIKKKYPKIMIVLWASLECTNFSKAKGGQARDADSRTLALDLHRYIDTIKPHVIYIENVEEFMSWGPLDDNGKPISKLAGEDYIKWINDVNGQGYKHDYRLINSADLGAYTSRKRYFGQFVLPSADFHWPDTTHSKKQEGGKHPWKPVKDVLNLTNHGVSIFARKKDLSPKTIERILSGAKRYVSYKDPAFMVKYHGRGNNILDVYGPASCLTTKDRLALLMTQFIDKQYTSGTKHSSLDTAAGSVTTVPKMNLVSCEPYIIDTQFGNTGQEIHRPLGVITANRKWHYLINPQWFNNSPISIENPCPTLIARMDKSPLYVATATSAPAISIYILESVKEKVNRVVQTANGNLVYTISIFDNDTTKELILFMAVMGIIDIKMRMLEIDELLRIQGFPKNYVLKGTKTLQKKFIGNSVVPLAAKRLIESNFK